MKILEVILTHIVIGVIIFFAVICRSEAREHARILDEPVGTAYDAGSTWIDAQHEGTAGKMIGVDETGWIHVVWTNELVQSLTVRHVFYNLWVPSTGSFLFNVEGGIQVDATVRAANATQTTLPYGACFPAFNFQGIPVSEIYTGAAIDFLPQAGAFMTSSLIPLFETEILYPKIAASGDSTLHIVSTENDAVNPGQPRRIFYSRGTPEYDEFGFGEDINWQNVAGAEQFLTIDTSMTVSADIAASRISQRVAIVWAKSRDDLTGNPTDINNDIYLRISENGGITWNPRINITEFLVRDPGCPNETLQCNVDTLRACGDASIIFDETDFIHIAFTTRTFFEYGHPGLDSGALTKAGLSGIWHWSEETDSLSPVASAYYPMTAENGAVLLDPGEQQMNVQRPSLAVDETTGYLYCSYQLFDSSQYSVAMYPMADAFVSVSTDGGINWSVGTNITDSAPAVIPAPVGGSMHERDITLADRVSYHNAAGYLHMEYVLDEDAGTAAHEEGVVTNNFVYYHRIPIIDIAASPLVPQAPIHADCELPPAPYELAASENDCDRISLFWMDESNLETMFVISRTPDDTTFFLSAANGIISYIDSTAVPGTEYSYYVAAGNACGLGPSSHVFGIRLSVPEQVTGLTAEGDCGQITLTWQPLAGNVASYLIYRDLIPQPIATIDAAVAQYADSGVADSYGHIYRVQAENICGLSEDSEVTIGSLLPLFSFEQLLPDTVYCLQYLNVLTRYCPGTDSVEFSLSEANGPFTSFGGQIINEPEPITIMIPDVGRVIEQARLMVVSFRDLRIDTTISEHFILDCMLDIDETPLPIPEAFYLSQNFPNPFNASTTIVYDLPAAVHAVMKVYDVMGREVSELVNGMQSAGRHEAAFNASTLTSGIYFCRFEAGDFTAVRKMVLMK